MRDTRPGAILLAGIGALVWGLVVVSYQAVGLLSVSWGAVEGSMFAWIGGIVVVFQFVLGVGLVISGIGLIRRQHWSRQWMLCIVSLVFLGLVTHVLIFGPTMQGPGLLAVFGVAVLLTVLLNRRASRAFFPQGSGVKIFTAFLCVLICLEGLTALAVRNWLLKRPNVRLEKGVYALEHDSASYGTNHFRTPFPYRYSMVLPSGFTLHGVFGSEKTGTLIALLHPELGTVTMTDDTIPETLRPLPQLLGWSNDYALAKKYFMEEIGLLFLGLRMVGPEGMSRVEEAESNGVRILLIRIRRENAHSTEFHVFRDGEALGGGMMVMRKGTHEITDQILESLQPQEKPIRTADDYAREGQVSLQQGDVEGAKMMFASALQKNWNNVTYHELLAQAYIRAGDLAGAKRNLEHFLKLEPAHDEIRKLLEKLGQEHSKTT